MGSIPMGLVGHWLSRCFFLLITLDLGADKIEGAERLHKKSKVIAVKL